MMIVHERWSYKMSNYDLNIWDRLGYETEYEFEGWSISVYSIPEEGASYGSGELVTSLDLTLEESMALTLGESIEEGGDYTPDADFWLDLDSFTTIYNDIPFRVEAFLASLNKEEDKNDSTMLSVWQEVTSADRH